MLEYSDDRDGEVCVPVSRAFDKESRRAAATMKSTFWIIGAPKSGTGSLFNWLDEHPSLAGSTPKETFFFMDQEHPLCGAHGRSCEQDGSAAFKKFFDPSLGERIRFEATTHTYYQQIARRKLTTIEPQPLIVMLLREPAARLLSSFRFTRDNLANCDRSLTFDQYVDWLLAGKMDELDRYYHSASSLWIAKRELELGRYVEWIDWWLERLEADRLQLILFEQLRAEPESVMTNLCGRLDVDAGFYREYAFDRWNKTYAVGRQRVHRVARRVGQMLPRSLVRERAMALYLRWQNSTAPKDDDYQEGLERMRAYFAPSNRDLAARYKLNLERWWGNAALSTVHEATVKS